MVRTNVPNRICIHRKVRWFNQNWGKIILKMSALICFVIFIFIHLVDAFMHSVLQINTQIYQIYLFIQFSRKSSGPSNNLSYILSLLLTQYLSLSLLIRNSVFRWCLMLKSRKLTHFSLSRLQYCMTQTVIWQCS